MSVDVGELVELWFRDIRAFATTFDLRSKDKDYGRMVPTAPQIVLWDALRAHSLVQILKGRQIYATTAVLVWALRDCIQPGTNWCVAAQTDETAVEIARFCTQLYRGNEALRHILPVVRERDHGIVFANESQIRFGPANSEFWRGGKTHGALCTEAAMYEDLGATLASLGQSVPASGKIILETTAKGENDYYHMWIDPTSRFHRLFLSWSDHPEYSADHPSYPTDGLREMPTNLTPMELAYLRKVGTLPADKTLWAINKIRTLPTNKRHLFEQEYPLTAMDAFVLSGDKFIKQPLPLPADPLGPMVGGVLRILPFDPSHQYVAGVDTASGAETGDASTVVVLDLTAKAVAASLEVRLPIPLFCKAAHHLLSSYGMPVTCVEVNSFGLVVMDELRRTDVPMYLRFTTDGLTLETRERHGWMSTAQTRPILYGNMFSAVQGPSSWRVGCPRLTRQLNALVYDKGGKPAAPSGQHDDLAVAFGLALQAIEQAHPPQQSPASLIPHAPRSIGEEMEFIRRFGYEAVRAFAGASRDTADFQP